MRKKIQNDTPLDINILMLDDEMLIMESVKSNIERLGYNCIITTDHAEALKMIKEENPRIDIFITDYLMVGITAVQVVEQIRSFNRNLYIILLTGYSQNMPGLYALKNLAIDSYAEKNTDFEDLMMKIEIAVKNIQKVNPTRFVKDGLKFHEKIKRLRLENNKTQDEIAEYLGVGRTTVVNYEHGRIRPNLENIRKLANLYNVTCDYLLE